VFKILLAAAPNGNIKMLARLWFLRLGIAVAMYLSKILLQARVKISVYNFSARAQSDWQNRQSGIQYKRSFSM